MFPTLETRHSLSGHGPGVDAPRPCTEVPGKANTAHNNCAEDAEKILRFEPLPVGIEEGGDEQERQDEEQQVVQGVNVTHKENDECSDSGDR